MQSITDYSLIKNVLKIKQISAYRSYEFDTQLNASYEKIHAALCCLFHH